MAAMVTLQSGDAALSLDADGRLTSLRLGGVEWVGTPRPLFTLTAQGPWDDSVLGPHRRLTGRKPVIGDSSAVLFLGYDGLWDGDERLDIVVEVQITPVDGGFEFLYAIDNRTESWLARELRGPRIGSPLASKPALLWPAGAGDRFADPAAVPLRHGLYPSRLTMPWMALDGGGHGLYLGLHDGSLRASGLHTDATLNEGELELALSQYPFCAPGAEWDSPPLVVRPYAGSWHVAADLYRESARPWWSPTPPPEWVKRSGGWQLVIMKQQNGEIHWPYTDMDKLIALGEETGLNILGLFGWTRGGHDRHYPIYEPDPAMGGEAGLREGIAKAHAAGQKVILYVNGQLLDMKRPWYARHGLATAAINERGEPFGQTWQKYHDAPQHPMACACQSCVAWSDHLLAQAKLVQSLGADGIIFDQLGAADPPFCFSTKHGHADPAMATGPGVLKTILRVQAAMHETDPDFAVITEHVTDAISQHIDLTHGCQSGFTRDGSGFPELMRYTFPELRATMRFPTPVMDRTSVNWGCLYGYYHELEYRYEPDRAYAERGVRPEYEDYERVCSRPEIHWLRRLDPRQANAYLRQVVGFANRHADLIRHGRFRDTLGFTVDNPAVIARAYVDGGRTGVLVWNRGDTPQAVTVTVPGAEFTSADAPGGEADPAAPIPPDSLRILIFTQRG